ncbi:hypothetical protein, partial [Roseovarius sp. SYSU LYC5161]|uniref:hypothetical protein n=1 Tax=Roseovarius halophilus (ex Wu et al. 2025) TaxID=3376060 RepID=UPI00399B4267
SISTNGSRLASRLAYRSERSKKPICAIVLPPSRLATPSYRSAGFRAIFRGALLSDIYESEFDQSLGWGDFGEDLQKWEKLIANLEVD